MSSAVRVVVAGATGKTGSAVTRALLGSRGIRVVGAVAKEYVGEDLGQQLGLGPLGIPIHGRLRPVLEQVEADVLVDFTAPAVAVEHIEAALAHGLACVVGTTGIPEPELLRLGREAEQRNLGLLVIANFSIGVMLLKRFAREAARYFPEVEIIEKHHNTKLDAPSGTALRLGEAIAEVIGRASVPIHSVRLPGFIAHHDVLFGGAGETLTLSHDTMSRDAFGPGVVHAVLHAHRFRGLVTDFETVLQAGTDEEGVAAPPAG